MIEGIVNINKEQNMTSHDVVARIRRLAGTRRVGHTGTLDPMAEGVLPVCIGRATRIVEYLDPDWKKYRCTMVLGRRMDTQDVWGTEIGRSSEDAVNAVTEEQVRSAFAGFRGVIEQTPPMYSALKVNGRKLYEYARAGETVEVKSRQVCIRSLAIESMELGRGYESSITFTCECSKGTYIRAICEEAGEKLGVHGAMAALTRIATGIFTIEQSHTLRELEALYGGAGQPGAAGAGQRKPEAEGAGQRKPVREFSDILVPIPEALTAFGKITLSGKDVWRFTNGLVVWERNCKTLCTPRYATEEFPLPLREEFRRAYSVFDDAGKFLGVGFMDAEKHELKADKVFRT